MPPTLTIAPLAAPNMTGAIGWSLVLIAFVVIAFFVLVRLRRWIKEDADAGPSEGIGFTLSDFRRLHREGKMTDEEFDRLRSKMVAGAKAMAQSMPDPLARKSPPGRRPPGDAAGSPPQRPDQP